MPSYWRADGTLCDGSYDTQLTGSNAKVDGAASPIIPSMLYNGSTYDLQRGNTKGTLLASAARTSTTTSPTQTNHNSKGLQITVNVPSGGTGSLSVILNGTDPVSGGTIQLNGTPTTITAAGRYVYEISPGLTGTGGHVVQRISGIIGRDFSVTVTHTDGSSWTYSVGYALI